MAYQLSPGVAWSEIDLTTIVPSASTTSGGFAGEFMWGPLNEVVTLGNELNLISNFGLPTTNNSSDFFTCANFLSYAQNLQVVRAANTLVAVNATSGPNPKLIMNQYDYETNYMDLSLDQTYGMFAARYPGAMGNSLKVSAWVANNKTTYLSWPYHNEFAGCPTTSDFVARLAGANDEMHIIVVDAQGQFSGGLANTVLEKFSFVSKATDAMNDDGTSNYWVNVLNEKSKYIYAINPAVGSNWGNTAYGRAFTDGGNTSFTNALVGGADGRPTDGDIQNAYDLFKPVDSITVSLLMTGGHSQGVSEYVIQNIAEVRKDCVAFVSPLMADVVDNSGHEATDIVSYRNDFNASSYAVMDSAWKKQYDKYNNVYSWVPLNGDIAGLCARTDYTNDAWFSPAGLNRGLIKNVVKLSWNPQQAERDTLYSNSVNPVVTFKGTGTVLYGDKTLTNKPSAFDRINVRRLFIVLETTISKAAKYSLFEFNDDFTRSQFVSLVEPFLRDVKGRRGIYDYKVVCDNTNNTPQVIDSNQFVGDIYIKPARSINFIQLNFIAVGTGVDFTQVIGKF